MPEAAPLSVIGTVEVTAKVNVRQGAPQRTAPVLRKLAPGTSVQVTAVVMGESVQGNAQWYRTEENSFVWSGACSALGAATVPPPMGQPLIPAAPTIDPVLAGYGLDPQFATKLTTLLQACRERGHDFRISQGLRTPQRQARYYCQWDQRSPAQINAKVTYLNNQGAPWLANLLKSYRDIPRQKAWQTNALPGAGWHQWGEAADCYCFRGGQMVSNGSDPCYRVYADLAQQLGLTAGLYFSTPDAGHVQLRPGNATDVYGWPNIDSVMKERFGEKPALDD